MRLLSNLSLAVIAVLSFLILKLLLTNYLFIVQIDIEEDLSRVFFQ